MYKRHVLRIFDSSSSPPVNIHEQTIQNMGDFRSSRPDILNIKFTVLKNSNDFKIKQNAKFHVLRQIFKH